MVFDHRFHDSSIIRDTNFLTSKFIEVSHWLRLLPCSDDDFDVFGEALGQPEGDISFFSTIFINKVIDSFEDKNNFIIEDI